MAEAVDRTLRRIRSERPFVQNEAPEPVRRLRRTWSESRDAAPRARVDRETAVPFQSTNMTFTIELEQEADGRWIAEVPELPGTLAYGASSEEATAKVKALALRVLADRLEHGETDADLGAITFAAA